MSESNHGKSWYNEARFATFKEADKLRKSIQARIDKLEESTGQVKVKRMADDTFIVKVRGLEKEKKSRKKGKNKRKKD